MSGGQQQRVAIARAIVGERRLILADEPTGALDTETGEEILRLLRARCDAGAAGVLVTHEARHAAWADRVVFLRDGVVVDESGADPVDVLLEPACPMTPLTGWRLPLRLARRDAPALSGAQHPGAGDDRAAGAGGDAPPPSCSRPRTSPASRAWTVGWALPRPGSRSSGDRARSSRTSTPTTASAVSVGGRGPSPAHAGRRRRVLGARRARRSCSERAGVRVATDDRRRCRGHRARPARPADRRPLRADLRPAARPLRTRWSSTRRSPRRGTPSATRLEASTTLGAQSAGCVTDVVGIAESATVRDYPSSPAARQPRAASAERDRHDWLVGGGPVCWARSTRSTQLGCAPCSRAPWCSTRRRTPRSHRDCAATAARTTATARRAGAGRGDGAARGRAAGRPGVRGRCPPAGAHAWR